MPRIWPIVMTPVPPMPVTRMSCVSSSAGSTGAGSGGIAVSRPLATPFLSVPPSTVTKLGQNPLTHE